MAAANDAIAAESLALKALGFLAESEGALVRFMAASGLNLEALRSRAGEPELLAAILDFLLSDDSLLTAFCEAETIEPRSVHMARARLPGGEAF